MKSKNNSKLKAFSVYMHPHSWQDPSWLVYAKRVSEAKVLGKNEFESWDTSLHLEFTDMRAVREQQFDQYAKDVQDGYVILDNSELPEDAPDFYWEDISVY